MAVNTNCSQLNFSVLDWNQPSIAFYNSLGATGRPNSRLVKAACILFVFLFVFKDLTLTEGWHNFQMDRLKLQQLARITPTKKSSTVPNST